MNKAVDGLDTALGLLEHMFDVEMRFVRGSADDKDLLATAFHKDVVIHEPRSLPYAGDWTGLDELSTLFRKMQETWSDMAVDNLQAVSDGDTVFMACTLSMTCRVNGIKIVQPFAEMLRFEAGLLIEATPFYYDTEEIVSTLAR
jgi:ketosteroid isomerase-like protein